MKIFKSFLSWAPTAMLAALVFSACSDQEVVETASDAALNSEATPVTFGTYLTQSAQTRAGKAGDIVNPGADGNTLGSLGYEFGVFGYYGDGVKYSETPTNANFMYNQQVSYASSAWTYSPIKYWPNEFGATAISTGTDYLTFFAYAPYVSTASGTTGITAFVEPGSTGKTDATLAAYDNTTTGDPRIKYVVAANPAEVVDLLWGVAENTTDYEIADNGSLTPGKPWIDITKQTTDGKVKFLFKHALAKMTFKIDADVDKTEHNHSIVVDDKTKIYVREVTISGAFTTEGYLNLNNTKNLTADTPRWEAADGTDLSTTSSITYKDGRTNGYEGCADEETPTATSGNATEANAYLNPTIIQTTSTALNTLGGTGVTNSPANLLTGDSFYVIPSGSANLSVTITYDVLTVDENLAGGLSDDKSSTGSNIENKITKSTALAISAGNAYTITLHLGMTSVKMEAEVSPWSTETTEEVDLPINKASE